MNRQTKISIAISFAIITVLMFLVFISVPENNTPGFWLEEKR
jgi:hypothetical protein